MEWTLGWVSYKLMDTIGGQFAGEHRLEQQDPPVKEGMMHRVLFHKLLTTKTMIHIADHPRQRLWQQSRPLESQEPFPELGRYLTTMKDKFPRDNRRFRCNQILTARPRR